jgi:hypothetical protein
MSRIFISYRRGDSRGSAGRLYDDLEERFGKDVVFRDLDAIEPGAEYSEVIDSAIARCDALIAVIGNQWLEIRDSEGRRRLDNPDDLVRLEIASALARDKLVLPVLVEDAVMPSATDLPPDLAPLAGRNALSMSDDRWEFDLDRLGDRLERVVAPKRAKRAAPPATRTSKRKPASFSGVPQKRMMAVVGGLIALILLILLGGLLLDRGDDGTEVRAGSSDTTTGAAASQEPTGSAGGSSPNAARGKTFTINVGDTVAEGQPPGAGKIDKPGAVHRYTFSGKAQQTIFLKLLSASVEGEGLVWTLYDPMGRYVTRRVMPQDLGRETLRDTGTYSLEVEGREGGTGTYSFSLTTVTPENLFAIDIGGTVAEGQPPGAGNIAKPGVVQRYTFSATAGQTVYVKLLSVNMTGMGLSWTLYDPSGAYVARRVLPQEIGRQTLRHTGTYSLEVEGNKDSTGTYSFALTGI